MCKFLMLTCFLTLMALVNVKAMQEIVKDAKSKILNDTETEVKNAREMSNAEWDNRTTAVEIQNLSTTTTKPIAASKITTTTTTTKPIGASETTTTATKPIAASETTATTIKPIAASNTTTTKSIPASKPTTPTTTTPLNPFENKTNKFNINNSNDMRTISGSNTTAISLLPSPSINESRPLDPYCEPSLCERFNGTHTQVLPHIACHNHGNFAPSCGSQPHLLYMSERRRNLILDLHNLARSRIASGQVDGYKPATHMPQLKWDSELEYLATLHAKRCKFTHDSCRNAARFPFSGQNIAYYWIRREIKSHSRRIKNFIVSWFKEYLNANQTFIDSYDFHPEGKQIGHFTQLVSDRVHLVGCAAIRFNEPEQRDDTKLLLTCNYDYTNIWGERIYESGPTASKCVYKQSGKYPDLCDWNEPVYEYDTEEYPDDNNQLDNNIGE